MEEWQRQQRAMKDADRQQKKGAENILKNYRGTHQAAWDRKQKELKEADRQSRDIAIATLKNYRGGEHDIKEYERMVANYRQQLIEQSRERHRELQMLDSSDASPGASDEDWKELVEQHIKEFEQLAAEHALEQFQGLEGSPLRRMEQTKFDGFPDATCQEFKPTNASTHGFLDEEKRNDQSDEELVHVTGRHNIQSEPSLVRSKDDKELEEEKGEEEKSDESNPTIQAETESSDLLASSLPQVDLLATPSTDNKQLIELDFSFGLIYRIHSPPPSMDACAAAAERIVPVSLGRTLSQTLPKSVWDSNFQAVVRTVEIDAAFEGNGRTNRYVVKGTVPIHINMQVVASSSSIDGPVDSPRSELIIGRSDEPRWRRVRTGQYPSWNSILTHKATAIW
eukprot:scaffold22713_cov139-Cylindrotheca_fusiformis.AAC.7